VSLESNPVQGNMVQYTNILSVSNLKLEIGLKRDNSGLKTIRRRNMNLLTLITSLLGSVFFILSFIRGLMKFLENKYDNMLDRKQRIEDAKKQKKRRKTLLA